MSIWWVGTHLCWLWNILNLTPALHYLIYSIPQLFLFTIYLPYSNIKYFCSTLYHQHLWSTRSTVRYSSCMPQFSPMHVSTLKGTIKHCYIYFFHVVSAVSRKLLEGRFHFFFSSLYFNHLGHWLVNKYSVNRRKKKWLCAYPQLLM